MSSVMEPERSDDTELNKVTRIVDATGGECSPIETVNPENNPSPPPVSLSHQCGEEKINDVMERRAEGRQRTNNQQREEEEKVDNKKAVAIQERKRKRKGTDKELDPVQQPTQQSGFKMKIKRKKMVTRQSAARHVVMMERTEPSLIRADKGISHQNDDESVINTSEHNDDKPVGKTEEEDQSIVPDDQPSGNKEMKRKLSSSCRLPAGRQSSSSFSSSSLSSPSSCAHSCQQPRRRRSLGSILERQDPLTVSSSAPSSPATTTTIRSRRSSPTDTNLVESSCWSENSGPNKEMNSDKKTKLHSINSSSSSGFSDSTIDQMPAIKKRKTDPYPKDDCGQKPTAFPFISATVIAPAPIADVPKEKVDHQDAGTWVRTVGTTTDTECLGPCEPGTSITLEGVVWNETKGGLLVLNVTWRGKTYVGTLLDCKKYDWAPSHLGDYPFCNDTDQSSGSGWSSTSSGNGKSKGSSNGNGRGRKGNTNSHKRHKNNANSISMIRTDDSASKQENSGSKEEIEVGGGKKATAAILEPTSPVLFQCPFGKCEKKFSVLGLKYHQTSSHRNSTTDQCQGHQTEPADQSQEGSQSDLKVEVTKEAGNEDPDPGTRRCDEPCPGSRRSDSSCAGTGPSDEPGQEKGKLESKISTDPENGSERGPKKQVTDSPVYSDISEDDPGQARTTAAEPGTPAVPAQASGTPAGEKPMAIVGPQCASSSPVIVGPSEQRPVQRPRSPKPELDTGSGATDRLARAKCEIQPDDDDGCPPLLPSLVIRNSPIKLEPNSSSTDRHCGSCIPPLIGGSIRTPSVESKRLGIDPSPSPRIPSPFLNHRSSIRVPPGPRFDAQSRLSSEAAAIDAISHLRNPGLIFNPFSPASAAMFMANPGLFHPGMEAAASLIASQPPSSVYGPNDAALASAFALGLRNQSDHRCFGLLTPQSINSVFCPPSSSTRHSTHSVSPNDTVLQSHKIHELAYPVKRVPSNTQGSVLDSETLRRRQVTDTALSPSRGYMENNIRRSIILGSINSGTVSRPQDCTVVNTDSLPSSSSSSVPVSVIASAFNSRNGAEQFMTRRSLGAEASQRSLDAAKVPHRMQPATLNNHVRMVSDSSPPVQRHVHTHHHTHTTYPTILTSPVDPYATMVANQQAAAAASGLVGGYSPSFGSVSKA